MNRRPRPPAQDAGREIQALIGTLNANLLRLDELTAGELDTVADADGRTFMLRRAQEHMRRSEAAKQAAILNALPAHIAMLDGEGRVVTVNESWQRFASANALQSPQQGIGLNYLAICDGVSGDGAADAQHAAAGIRAVLAGAANTFSLEYPCQSATGLRWFRLQVTPLGKGRRNGVVTTHLDVTEQRLAEDDLRESELRFRQMAENIRDAFFLISADDGRILYMSPAYEEIWGRSCDSLYANANAWIDAVHPEDRARVVRNFADGAISGRFDQEYRITRTDLAQRWVRVRGYPIPGEAGGVQRIAGIAVDITARKAAEAEIHQLNETLERRVVERTAQLVSLNKELEAFSYSVSHDLRAPLRHVMGYVELLREDAGDSLSADSLRHLNTISRSGKRMGDLIDALLAFSHLGRAHLQKTGVNLDRLVQKILEELGPDMLDRDILWKIGPLPLVNADPSLLQMVLTNLLANAVKFTRNRAEAVIEIGRAAGAEGEIVIFVRDNGAGFNQEYASGLFGVFKRLHQQSEFEGTGIGLANVQRIIERHGGRVWGEGVVDAGATFYFSLPE
jgi:PAS domain S-box-containing protein